MDDPNVRPHAYTAEARQRKPEQITRPAADALGPPFEIEFDITTVGGTAGEILAPPQAEAILDVLTWLCEHTAGTNSGPQEQTPV